MIRAVKYGREKGEKKGNYIGTKQVGRELRSSEAGWILSGTDEVTVGYCLVFLRFWVQEW